MEDKLITKPLKFKSVEELQEKIDNYFESCWEEDDDGKRKQVKPYTVTGLANYLDTTRETLLDYEKRDEFSDTIKRAKSKCEQFAEEYLFTGKNTAGAIFNLINNYKRWENKKNTDLTSKGESIKTVNQVEWIVVNGKKDGAE